LGKILKKVVENFFGQMCGDEFFLKHALAWRSTASIIFSVGLGIMQLREFRVTPFCLFTFVLC